MLKHEDGRYYVSVDHGEFFLKLNVEDCETGEISFTAGIYPEEDFPNVVCDKDTLSALLTAGILKILQEKKEFIYRKGFEFCKKDKEIFDFILAKKELNFFNTLSKEDIKFLRTPIEGEA